MINGGMGIVRVGNEARWLALTIKGTDVCRSQAELSADASAQDALEATSKARRRGGREGTDCRGPASPYSRRC